MAARKATRLAPALNRAAAPISFSMLRQEDPSQFTSVGAHQNQVDISPWSLTVGGSG